MEPLSNNHIPHTYRNVVSLTLRIATICLGSFFIGVSLVTLEVLCRNGKHYQEFQGRSMYKLASGIITLAAVVGAFPVSRVLSIYFSRRYTLIIGCAVGITGTIILLPMCQLPDGIDYQVIVTNPLLWVGRIVQGIAVGIFSVSCLLTISEIAPVELKMLLGAMYQLSIQLGMVTAYLVESILVETSANIFTFRALLLTLGGLSVFVMSLQTLLLLFIYKQETPQYLFHQGLKSDAKLLINKIYREQCSNEIYLQQQAQNNIQDRALGSSFFAQFELLKISKKVLFLGIYVAIVQQMSGINYFNVYGVYDSLQSNLLYVGLPAMMQLLGTLLLVVLNTDYFKSIRKYVTYRIPLIQWGVVISLGIMSMYLVSSLIQSSVPAAQSTLIMVKWALLNLYMLVFGFTLGPIICLYLSETLQLRKLQVAMGTGWMFAFINISLIPMMSRSGSWTQGMISQVLVLGSCLVFIFTNRMWLVETKNRTPLEIARSVNQLQIACL